MLKWFCPTAVSHLKDGMSYPTAHDSWYIWNNYKLHVKFSRVIYIPKYLQSCSSCKPSNLVHASIVSCHEGYYLLYCWFRFFSLLLSLGQSIKYFQSITTSKMFWDRAGAGDLITYIHICSRWLLQRRMNGSFIWCNTWHGHPWWQTYGVDKFRTEYVGFFGVSVFGW